MKLRTLAPLIVAITLMLAGSAYALPPFSATLANGGAYDATWSSEINANLYTYHWEVAFNGIGTGYANERMTGFALYGMPDSLYFTGKPDTITQANAATRTVAWSKAKIFKNSGDVFWDAKHPGSVHKDPVFVGEKLGVFTTTFTEPGLPTDYFSSLESAIHVAWSEDNSEWINNTPEGPTPEPISAVLLALGLPVALAVRRRHGQSSDDA